MSPFSGGQYNNPSKRAEPDYLRRRIDNLMLKLKKEYPNGIVSKLNTNHKKQAETVRELAKTLGYSNAAEFLRAYGFVMEIDKGGRPQTTASNYTDIINELKRRYPDGAPFGTVTKLVEANLDLKAQLKTLRNQAPQLFGMKFKNYLLGQGILAGNSNAEVQRIQLSKKKEKEGIKLAALVNEISKRYPEGAIRPDTLKKLESENPDLKISAASNWVRCLEDGKSLSKYFEEQGILVPKSKVPKIEKKVEIQRNDPPIPRDIQKIKELVEQGKVLRASMKSGAYSFLYETICPNCGKHKLVDGDSVSWNYHEVSVSGPEDWVKRNQKVQLLLDKYSIDLKLDDNLEKEFAKQRGTCICDLNNSKMKPFLECGCDTAVEAVGDDGSMTVTFEVAGTGYEGRTARIEKHKAGEKLVYRRERNNRFSRNHIAVLGEDGENLGSMPSVLSDEIAPLVDRKTITLSGYIKDIETRAQRGKYARKAQMFASVTLQPIDSQDPMGWLFENRIQTLIRRKNMLEIFGYSDIKAASKKQLVDYNVAKELPPSVRAYVVNTSVIGFEYGDCRYAVEELKVGAPVNIKRLGLLSQGNDTMAVYDTDGNRLGNIPRGLSFVLAPLLDFDRLEIIRPTYVGQFKVDVPQGYLGYACAKVKFLMIVSTSGSALKRENKPKDKIEIEGNPSEELKQLITHIKQNHLESRYNLAINYDGILYLVDAGRPREDDGAIEYDFGFDCDQDNGFFFLFKQVPDDDPIAILAKNGILVGRLEDYDEE